MHPLHEDHKKQTEQNQESIINNLDPGQYLMQYQEQVVPNNCTVTVLITNFSTYLSQNI